MMPMGEEIKISQNFDDINYGGPKAISLTTVLPGTGTAEIGAGTGTEVIIDMTGTSEPANNTTPINWRVIRALPEVQ